MKALSFAVAAALVATSVPAFAADVAAGKEKSIACVACHGNDAFPGIFYTLQLAGRNADKLTIKTMKYKNLKIVHPMMNMSTVFFNEKDIEDISAYYQSLGKPMFTSPLITIKGDDDEQIAAAPASQSYAAR
jgi:cytochrome c553